MVQIKVPIFGRVISVQIEVTLNSSHKPGVKVMRVKVMRVKVMRLQMSGSECCDYTNIVEKHD